MEAVVEMLGDVAIVELTYDRIDAYRTEQFKRDMAPVLR